MTAAGGGLLLRHVTRYQQRDTELTAMSGKLYVISAASGAGKTSLVKALVESTEGILVSVSCTTRPRRTGETDGVHYHFLTPERFQSMLDDGGFLEHASVFDNRYGTSRAWVQERLQSGFDVILEIDWQGARQVREQHPDVVSVFVLPPSREELESRLRGRGQDSDQVIARRMQDAVAEMSHYHEFDYLVVNDDFETALGELKSIVHAERLRQNMVATRERRLISALLA